MKNEKNKKRMGKREKNKEISPLGRMEKTKTDEKSTHNPTADQGYVNDKRNDQSKRDKEDRIEEQDIRKKRIQKHACFHACFLVAKLAYLINSKCLELSA